jgi:uncharacterized protein YlxW (UPF0749 family)
MFLIIGILAANQYILYKKIGLTKVNSDPQERAVTVSRLYFENEKLRLQFDDRQTQRIELENATSNNAETQKILEKERAKYQILLGQTEVYGQGIIINMNHTMVLTQIVDFVNALRNSGAEAISINNQRILTNTPFEQFDGKDSYEIKVIGNKDVLYDAITRPGGIFELIINGTAARADYLLLPKAS